MKKKLGLLVIALSLKTRISDCTGRRALGLWIAGTADRAPGMPGQPTERRERRDCRQSAGSPGLLTERRIAGIADKGAGIAGAARSAKNFRPPLPVCVSEYQ